MKLVKCCDGVYRETIDPDGADVVVGGSFLTTGSWFRKPKKLKPVDLKRKARKITGTLGEIMEYICTH